MKLSEITTFETYTRRGTEIMNNLNRHAGKLCTRHQFALSSWEGRCSSGRSNYATATNQYAAPASKKNEPLLAAGTNFCPVHWPHGAGEQANGGSVSDRLLILFGRSARRFRFETDFFSSFFSSLPLPPFLPHSFI